MQVKYLNQALSRFNSTIVIPVNFALFTTSTLIGSAILYRDFEHLSTLATTLSLLGIGIMFFGVYLITLEKETEASIDSESSTQADRISTPHLAPIMLFPNSGLALPSPIKFSMPQGIPRQLRRYASFQYPTRMFGVGASSVDRPLTLVSSTLDNRGNTDRVIDIGYGSCE